MPLEIASGPARVSSIKPEPVSEEEREASQSLRKDCTEMQGGNDVGEREQKPVI
jgi:hypothetical protein